MKESKEIIIPITRGDRKESSYNIRPAENKDIGFNKSKYMMVGESSVFRETLGFLKEIAEKDSTVLIEGETGVGKELATRYIHNNSKRKNKSFVILNCAALPKDMIEDELFGHIKGAFTSATHDRVGKFEHANHGTIFLDEIGEMLPEMQKRLLRVIEEKEINPVGSNKVISVDVRIICATNKSLIREVKKGNFREDLFYRLNVLSVIIPPLRNRQGNISDINLLALHFLDMFRKETQPGLHFSKEAIEKLERYSWPGNVRELKYEIERAVTLCKTNKIESNDILASPHLGFYDDFDIDTGNTLEVFMNSAKKEYVKRILIKHGGNRTTAAKELDIQRTYLARLIKRYNLRDEIPSSSSSGYKIKKYRGRT